MRSPVVSSSSLGSFMGSQVQAAGCLHATCACLAEPEGAGVRGGSLALEAAAVGPPGPPAVS